MNKLFLSIITLCVLQMNMQANHSLGVVNPKDKKLTQLLNSKKSRKISFIENKGQVTDQNYTVRKDILFSGTNGKYTFHLKNKGISYQLSKPKALTNSEKNDPKNAAIASIYRVDLNWVNANATSSIIKGALAESSSQNFYSENAPDGIFDIKSYASVTYKNIYKGIDIKWYENKGDLEYDYNVAAGADYKQIVIEVNGATQISTNAKGELIIKTPLGSIIEKAPLVKQGGHILPAKWVVTKNKVCFDIKQINPSQGFTIDPLVRVWGTYYGGTGVAIGEFPGNSVLDNSGNIYICGWTNSSNGTSIATAGAFQTTFASNSFANRADAFIAKFDASGNRLWATYYGTKQGEDGTSCATDPSGNVYLTGRLLWSNDTVPFNYSALVTPGAFKTTLDTNRSNSNTLCSKSDAAAFLVKFNSAGVRQWGTFYGDSLTQICGELGASGQYYGYPKCCTDNSGNVYLGLTAAFPYSCNSNIVTDTVVDIYTDTLITGIDTVITTHMDTTFNTGTIILDSTTYFSLTNNSLVTNMAFTGSNANFPTAPVNTNNAVLVKFNGAGNRLWGTFVGGNLGTTIYDLCTDPSDNVIVSGITESTARIASAGAFKTAYGGGDDGFVIKFNGSGIKQWGTYYGGALIDGINGICSDLAGNIFISGQTASTTSISTASSYQLTFGGGAGVASDRRDGFLAKFNASGARQWGTYFGGSNQEQQFDVCTDLAGNIYITGVTRSANAISTAGTYQTARGGTQSVYFSQFDQSGVLQWSSYYGNNSGGFWAGTNNFGQLGSINVDGSGNIYVYGQAGSTSSGIASAGSHQPSYASGGSADCFLAKFNITMVLPLDLIAFEATCRKDRVEINWTDASAVNTKQYSLERSQDGLNFAPIATFQAEATLSGKADFNYVDTVTTADNLYYRLKLKEGDNAISYSKIIVANGCYSKVASLNAYPNPNNGTFLIVSNQELNLNIYNAQGQLVKNIVLNQANNFSYNVTGLDNGIYLVSSVNNLAPQKLKIVVAQ